MGGNGRAEIVSRVIKDRAERAVRERGLDRTVAEQSLFDLRATFALLKLAMDGVQSAAWATDQHLTIRIACNGELSAKRNGMVFEVGKTVYDAFKTRDPEEPGIKAHLAALEGKQSTVRLKGEFSKMILRVVPLRNEEDEIVGCVSLMASLSHLLKS